jgi:plastocyanin
MVATKKSGIACCMLLLSMTLLMMTSCKSDGSTNPSENKVIVLDDIYSPATITVAVGRIVVWQQQGTNAHTVTSGTPGSPTAGTLFDSGTMHNGGGFTFTFHEAGNYPYFCRFHGTAGMTGLVQVR